MEAFISYCHKDEAALGRLHTHLAVLRRDGRIDSWYDREILAGEDLDAEIKHKLESSGIILLLISPDFLASDYCVDEEMRRALERNRAGEARVIPIIVEPCDWASTPLRDLKALPRDGNPISEWANQNKAYLDVVQELRRLLAAEDVARPAETIEPKRPNRSSDVGASRLAELLRIGASLPKPVPVAVLRHVFEIGIGELEDVAGRSAGTVRMEGETGDYVTFSEGPTGSPDREHALSTLYELLNFIESRSTTRPGMEQCRNALALFRLLDVTGKRLIAEHMFDVLDKPVKSLGISDWSLRSPMSASMP